MASPPPSEDHPPAKPAPAKPLTDLDFRSGARIEELNKLIQEYEARNSGTIRDAPELHQAKNHIFSLLGLVQKSDGRLLPVNRYLILSGGVQQGTVDVDLGGALPPLSPGRDYDIAFTLLVPILNAAGVPVTLDMKQSPPGHSRLSLQPFDAGTSCLWSDCCPGDEAYLAADQVAEWFFHAFAAWAKDLRVERRGCVTSAILPGSSFRVLYDIVPAVALRGWPEVAQPWLMQAHFWDGKLKEEDVAGGFYLLPSSGADWRLAFSASELHLRRILPSPLAWAFRAAVAILAGGRPLKGLGPYHLFTLSLWSCERLPSSYLSREENAAHAMLGLLDDLLASLVDRQLPNYFFPEWNLLEGFPRQTLESLAHTVAQARAEPSRYLRRAVERAKEAKRLAKAIRKQDLPSGTP